MQLKLLCLSLTLAISGWIATANAQNARIPGSTSPKSFEMIQEPPRAKLVGRNNHVSFYQLPQDRMICVVPNNKNIDPINAWGNKDSTRIRENIPNAIPRWKIIPDSSSKSFLPSSSFRLPRFNGASTFPYDN